MEQNFATAETQPAMPSPSVAVTRLVDYDSSDEEEDWQDSQNTSLPIPLNTSASRRASGQFSVFTPDDHNYLGMIWTPLLKRDVEKASKSPNKAVYKAVVDADRGTYFTETYSRPVLMEKYKSLFKNLLKRKRENKPLSFAFKA